MDLFWLWLERFNEWRRVRWLFLSKRYKIFGSDETVKGTPVGSSLKFHYYSPHIALLEDFFILAARHFLATRKVLNNLDCNAFQIICSKPIEAEGIYEATIQLYLV